MILICGNNELVVSLRFYGTAEWVSLVCKVEFSGEIRWEIYTGCSRGG